MPEIRLPGPLKRRDILYGPETTPEKLVEYGRAYEEAGRLDDALQFYEQAGDRAGLARVKEGAFELGDAFTLPVGQTRKLRLAYSIPSDVVSRVGWHVVYVPPKPGGGSPAPRSGDAAG